MLCGVRLPRVCSASWAVALSLRLFGNKSQRCWERFRKDFRKRRNGRDSEQTFRQSCLNVTRAERATPHQVTSTGRQQHQSSVVERFPQREQDTGVNIDTSEQFRKSFLNRTAGQSRVMRRVRYAELFPVGLPLTLSTVLLCFPAVT